MSQNDQEQSKTPGERLENDRVYVHFDEHNVLILQDSATQEKVQHAHTNEPSKWQH